MGRKAYLPAVSSLLAPRLLVALCYREVRYDRSILPLVLVVALRFAIQRPLPRRLVRLLFVVKDMVPYEGCILAPV